jgi:hypothetical protein
MGQHEIPTHLGVEDRMFWGLSARQVAILVCGASCAYWAWSSLSWLPGPTEGVLAALVALAGAATALIRPAGRGLEEWGFAWLHYVAMPRASTWRVREDSNEDGRPGRGGWASWEIAEHWREVEP